MLKYKKLKRYYKTILSLSYDGFFKKLKLLDLVTIHITGDESNVYYRARVVDFILPSRVGGQPQPIVQIIRGGTKTIRQQKIESHRFTISPLAITRPMTT